MVFNEPPSALRSATIESLLPDPPLPPYLAPLNHRVGSQLWHCRVVLVPHPDHGQKLAPRLHLEDSKTRMLDGGVDP